MCDTDYTGAELRAMAQELVAKVLEEDPFVAPEVAGNPELFCRELADAPKEIQKSVLNVQSGAQRNKEAMAWAKARAEERKARAKEAGEVAQEADEERPWSPGNRPTGSESGSPLPSESTRST